MPDRVVVPGPGYTNVFYDPSGIVGRDLLRRGELVKAAAQRQVGVRTGRLRASIKTDIRFGPTGDLMVSVGSDLPYAEDVDKGTAPHVIRPKNGRVLRFVNKNGEIVYARVVKHPGSDPNHFLTDNLIVVAR